MRRLKLMLALAIVGVIALFVWAHFRLYQHFSPKGPFAYAVDDSVQLLDEQTALKMARQSLPEVIPGADRYELVAAGEHEMHPDFKDAYLVRRRTVDAKTSGRVRFRNVEFGTQVFVRVELKQGHVECWVSRGK